MIGKIELNMKKIIIAICFILLSCSSSDDDKCPCETIRGYTIENCSGTDYSTASNTQLEAAESKSNCD